MNRKERDAVYRWSFRASFWNWHAKEGHYKPVFGRQVTKVCVTLFLGVIAIRFRLWGGKSLPHKVYTYYHPPIYKWFPYFDVDIRGDT